MLLNSPGLLKVSDHRHFHQGNHEPRTESVGPRRFSIELMRLTGQDVVDM
jgi:hypothetical protein